MALEILRDRLAALAVDRIPLDLLAGLAVDRIPPALLAGLVVDRIPPALLAGLADAATASGCCDSQARRTRWAPAFPFVRLEWLPCLNLAPVRSVTRSVC